MPTTHYIQTRQRRKFVPQWRHEDPGHEFTGVTMRAVYGRSRTNDEIEAETTYLIYARFSRPVTLREANDAAYDAFAEGCSCEHDCCGHWHGGAYIEANSRHSRSTKPRRSWVLRASYSRNY